MTELPDPEVFAVFEVAVRLPWPAVRLMLWPDGTPPVPLTADAVAVELSESVSLINGQEIFELSDAVLVRSVQAVTVRDVRPNPHHNPDAVALFCEHEPDPTIVVATEWTP